MNRDPLLDVLVPLLKEQLVKVPKFEQIVDIPEVVDDPFSFNSVLLRAHQISF